jgi:hypothetical protein
LGRIGPVTLAAGGETWAALLEYIIKEPGNFVSDAFEAAVCADGKNTAHGRIRKPAGQSAKARRIAPHLYVELRHWLKRDKKGIVFAAHPELDKSLKAHGINPAAGGFGTPSIRVLLKMINAAYGTQYGLKQYRDFYKNYIQKPKGRLAKVEAMHAKAGYPMNHKMFQEVLFPEK